MKYPRKSVDLIEVMGKHFDGYMTKFDEWCDKNKRGFSFENVVAFILGTRPEFLNGAYNFDTPDFKIGFFVERDGKYDIYFLNVKYAIELLFSDVYGMWRKSENIPKNSLEWQTQVKNLIKLLDRR